MSAPPRWKQLFAETIGRDIKEEKSILYYVLTTVDLGPPARPQGRYVVHRGFVNEQRSKNGDGNEPVQSGFGTNTCLLTTTDIRSPKAQQILKQKQQDGEAHVEVAWWMEKAQLQFRLACTAHLLPHADNEHAKTFDMSSLTPPADKGASFDWASERRRIFEKLNPGLLASFARPTPGSTHPNAGQLDADAVGKDHDDDEAENPWPMELPKPADAEKDQDKQHLAESDKHFALVVLAPYRVDVVDLERSKRSIFELQGVRQAGQQEQWSTRRVVP